MEGKKDFVRDNAYAIIAAVFFAGVTFGSFEYLTNKVEIIEARQRKKIELNDERFHQLQHRIMELEKCDH